MRNLVGKHIFFKNGEEYKVGQVYAMKGDGTGCMACAENNKIYDVSFGDIQKEVGVSVVYNVIHTAEGEIKEVRTYASKCDASTRVDTLLTEIAKKLKKDSGELCIFENETGFGYQYTEEYEYGSVILKENKIIFDADIYGNEKTTLA